MYTITSHIKSLTLCRSADTAGHQQNVTEIEVEIELQYILR